MLVSSNNRSTHFVATEICTLCTYRSTTRSLTENLNSVSTVYCASLATEATLMSDTPDNSQGSSDLSPAQRLEAPNTRLIDASIATINDMDTLRACIAYENQHQQRVPILRLLEKRAIELRS